MRTKNGELLEDRRPWPFTVKRRDRCVKRIMEETGIGRYEAEIAYRISTIGLVGPRTVEEKDADKVE